MTDAALSAAARLRLPATRAISQGRWSGGKGATRKKAPPKRGGIAGGGLQRRDALDGFLAELVFQVLFVHVPSRIAAADMLPRLISPLRS